MLLPHTIEIESRHAKANLFEVSDGLVAVIVFGDKTGEISHIRISGLEALGIKTGNLKCEALYPGKEIAVAVKAIFRKKELHLELPLERGCAVVHIFR